MLIFFENNMGSDSNSESEVRSIKPALQSNSIKFFQASLASSWGKE